MRSRWVWLGQGRTGQVTSAPRRPESCRTSSPGRGPLSARFTSAASPLLTLPRATSAARGSIPMRRFITGAPTKKELLCPVSIPVIVLDMTSRSRMETPVSVTVWQHVNPRNWRPLTTAQGHGSDGRRSRDPIVVTHGQIAAYETHCTTRSYPANGQMAPIDQRRYSDLESSPGHQFLTDVLGRFQAGHPDGGIFDGSAGRSLACRD